jgi:hypothetical protein
MATKKLILDFRGQMSAGSAFVYDIYIGGVKLAYLNSLNTVNLNYKVGASVNPNQIGIGTTLSDTINNTVSFLTTNYLANSSAGGYLTTLSYLRVGDKVEITVTSTASENLITFFKVYSSNVFLRLIAENPCEYAYVSNQSIGDDELDFINDLEANFYTIRNNTLNTNLGTFIPNNFNTRLSRGFSYSIVRSSTNETRITFDIASSISEANVNAYFSENNLYVNILAANESLSFDYSLDGTTYQSSSVFESLSVGNHTLYVRDSLGCVKTFSVTNSGQENINNVQPYTYISESNSLRFIKRVTHENCGNYKNQFNTLSCEENLQIPNKFTQLFQECDTIKTQIKTSYQNVEVYAKDNSGAFTEIEAQKIVNNIQISDKRDCTYYTYNGQLAVLFTTGNTYDYDTTDITGTYVLNGALPPYGTVGTWVETAYGNFQIANIRLADNGERSLIFNVTINLSSPVSGTIQTIYNRESYDIWEFDTDMSLFLNTTITIGIRFYQTEVDVNFPDVFWISEKISVKTRWGRSIEIVWSNSKNTDVYFYSGITMKNRLNNAFINTELSDGDVEIQKTDSQVISIDATNYNAVEFEALALTTGMVRKLKLALKHDNLIIENVPYKLAENPETERQGQSNFYRLKAKLLEAGDVWNQGTANTQTVYSNVELIGLLQGDADAEYIRTQ